MTTPAAWIRDSKETDFNRAFRWFHEARECIENGDRATPRIIRERLRGAWEATGEPSYNAADDEILDLLKYR